MDRVKWQHRRDRILAGTLQIVPIVNINSIRAMRIMWQKRCIPMSYDRVSDTNRDVWRSSDTNHDSQIAGTYRLISTWVPHYRFEMKYLIKYDSTARYFEDTCLSVVPWTQGQSSFIHTGICTKWEFLWSWRQPSYFQQLCGKSIRYSL